MRGPLGLLCLIMLVVSSLPAVSAEYGDEHNGYPVNVDGEVMYPYIPRDLAERHPDIVAALLTEAVMIDDEGNEIDASADPLNKVAGHTVFPYYPLLVAELQRLADEHPGKMRLSSAGQSTTGLDLWNVEIADFHNPDRVPLAGREVIYLDGGTHSNEYSGVYFVTEWLQFLLDEYETNETAKWIVENRHLFVTPMINPDGSNAFGRINAKAININRNFPGTWGTVEENPVLNNPGPYPASEPETQAVIGILHEVRPDFVQSTHCCGNLWLFPYGAEQLGNAPDFAMFQTICERVFPDLTLEVEEPDCGEIWSTIYPASGTTADQGYAQVGASSWTYEMSGRGAVAGPWGEPVIDRDPRVQETESWRGVMHGLLHTEKYGALPRIVDVAGTTHRLEVTVENQGWGNVSQATLRFGAHGISLPALEPGQRVVLTLQGAFDQDKVPVELEWKKRMHPDSNWGRVVYDIDLQQAGTTVTGLLPAIPTPPSMDHLLPDLPVSYVENLTEPQLLAMGVGLDSVLVEESPSLPAALAALALLALVAVRLRRR